MRPHDRRSGIREWDLVHGTGPALAHLDLALTFLSRADRQAQRAADDVCLREFLSFIQESRQQAKSAKALARALP